MLAVTSYKVDYLMGSRKAVDAQLKSYRALAKAAPGPALDAFTIGYFNTMVLALDHLFLHRLRAAEGKEGGPCNEVRLLCDGIKDNGGVLAKNSTIKYDPGKAITGLKIGDRIALDDKTFARLVDAFFDDIAARYP
jgi:hypothetical protein